MLKFINNFATTLTQPFSVNDNGLFISPSAAAQLAPLLDNVNHIHQLMLTLDDGVNVEIVVTDAVDSASGQVSVYRYQEQTTPLDWPGGTKVTARLTARALAALPVLATAMQLTDAAGLLQDADGNILTNPSLPTFFGGADPFGLTDI